MPSIPVTSLTPVSSTDATLSSGMKIDNDLLSEKSATASIVNGSASSKQLIFTGLAIGLGTVTLIIILSLLLFRLVKRDTKTSKIKGLKPLLLGNPAARTFDLEKCSTLALKSSQYCQSQAKSDSPILVSAAVPSANSSESLAQTVPTQSSPVPSVEDELFAISSEYQSWFFSDHNSIEMGLDMIPDTSVTLGDVDGGLPSSLTVDLLPQSSHCTTEYPNMVHTDEAKAIGHGAGHAYEPELKVIVPDIMATTQSAEQTLTHNPIQFILIISSDSSPCIPSKPTFTKAALTTKIDTYGPDTIPESLPVLNSEVPCAPETAVSVETGNLEDTGSKAPVTHNVGLGFTLLDNIDSSSPIASMPDSSPVRLVNNKDTKNLPSNTVSPASESIEIYGLIQDYADNVAENDEKKLVERKEESKRELVARSSAQHSSAPNHTQNNAKHRARRSSIGPPPSCPLPPLPPTKAIVSQPDAVQSGPKHRTHAPAKSIMKKPLSGQRTSSAVSSVSGTDRKQRRRHARIPSEDLLEKLARYAKIKSPDALYKPMRVTALETAAKKEVSSIERAPSPVDVDICTPETHRRPLSSLSQPRSPTKVTTAPLTKARISGQVITASRDDQENVVPSSDSKSSSKRQRRLGPISHLAASSFRPLNRNS